MNRLAKYVVACLGLVPMFAFGQSTQTIYKFIDEHGRVTYANSPIKGGAKIDLEPLTVIRGSPNATSVQTPAARAIPVAKVTSVPSPVYSITPAAVAFASVPAVASTLTATPATPATAAAPPPTTLASLDTNDKAQELVRQRRTDIRKRILQGEIQTEEKLLDAARKALGEEQRQSGDIRMKRATLTAMQQKPLIHQEVRAEIERHFERVRNLQDEVAMHEGSIAALREELLSRR